MKRVVVLTSSFPRWDGDHAGRFVSTLSLALRSSFDVVNVAPGDPRAAPDEETGAGRVRRFPEAAGLSYGDGMGTNVLRRPLRAAALPGFLRRAGRALSEELAGGGAVLSHWLLPSGLVAARVARALGRRHVAVVHGGDVHALRRMPLGRRIAAFIARRTDAFVAVSCDLAERLSALIPPGRRPAIEVIPMPVADVFAGAPDRSAARQVLGIGPEPLLLGIGRLIPIKGFDVLLRAAADIPGGRVVLLGDGPERRRLEATAATLGVPLEVAGFVPPETVAVYLAAADVLVLPSRPVRGGREEGSPVVLAEAMAAGCPVVASRTGGVPDSVGDGRTGLLVPPDDTEALAAALRSVFAEPALGARLAAGGRAAAEGRSPAAAAGRFAALLEG